MFRVVIVDDDRDAALALKRILTVMMRYRWLVYSITEGT